MQTSISTCALNMSTCRTSLTFWSHGTSIARKRRRPSSSCRMCLCSCGPIGCATSRSPSIFSISSSRTWRATWTYKTWRDEEDTPRDLINSTKLFVIYIVVGRRGREARRSGPRGEDHCSIPVGSMSLAHHGVRLRIWLFYLCSFGRVFNSVMKSVSCVDDMNYKPLAQMLNKSETDDFLDTLHRLLIFMHRLSNSESDELLFMHGTQ